MEYIKIKDMKQDQKTSTVVLLTAIEEKETFVSLQQEN